MDPNNLNTEKIEAVTEITEKAPVLDLHAALSEATETKAPIAESAANAWDFSKVETDAERKEVPGAEGIKSEEKKDPASTVKIPDAVRKASAETATMMFDQLLQLTGNFAVNQKFKKKLTPDELKRILEKDLEDCDADTLEESADKLLKKKFDRLLKNRDKTIKGIPLNTQETERCETSFMQYLKEKNTNVPSEYLLAFTLITIIADRSIEVFTD